MSLIKQKTKIAVGNGKEKVSPGWFIAFSRVSPRLWSSTLSSDRRAGRNPTYKFF